MRVNVYNHFMNLIPGQELDLTIDRLGTNGEGVGKWEGFTIFVEEALPGEIVRVKLYEIRKNFGRAKTVQILQKSIHRTSPPCPIFEICGGCQLMHLSYHEQLTFKRQRVIDALERIGKFTNIEVQPCEPSPNHLHYRNKIQMPCETKPVFRLGLYARNSHDLVTVDTCLIHCALGESVLKKVKTFLSEANCQSLKHVLIKTGVKTNEVLVIFVTAQKDDDLFFPLGSAILNEIPEVKGVVQNIQPEKSNRILSPHFRTLAGSDHIHDIILQHQIKISAASFSQVNPLQAEQLYLKAIDLCSLTKADTVLDAYCGVGALTLGLAEKASQVIGVECVADAIANAKENALVNKIENVQFICSLAEKYIYQLVNQKTLINVALLNPPRKGCEPSFLEALAKLNPKTIVYISCDPATLARDLQILSLKGYALKDVCPFDMFPQTAHVECVVRLDKN